MAEFGRDKLIGSLLQPKSGAKKPGKAIQELDDNGEVVEEDFELELNVDGEFVLPDPKQVSGGGQPANSKTKIAKDAPVPPQEPEGPSLFDEMMAAQAAAKKEKEAKTQKATNKSFGGGFKKGFFGSQSTKSGTTKKKSTGNPNVIDVKAPKAAEKTKPTSQTLQSIAKEVGDAMEESSNPAVKELQKGEWMTPDLMKIFASNPVISKGLMNPKCQQAMQLMQKNPEEARKRFGKDQEVDLFMREFGKVMSSHFEKMGEQQQQQEVNEKVKEQVGPLAEQAIRREEERVKAAKSTAQNPGIQPYDKKKAEEDKKVKDIVSNPELSAILMDPAMQRVLQECGDPIKFQQHMRNPETARKIDLLFKSGLVKTE